ncbi:hypothetical protein VTO42DRAFT_5762 [Malbranchea cinnamomea]
MPYSFLFNVRPASCPKLTLGMDIMPANASYEPARTHYYETVPRHVNGLNVTDLLRSFCASDCHYRSNAFQHPHLNRTLEGRDLVATVHSPVIISFILPSLSYLDWEERILIANRLFPGVPGETTREEGQAGKRVHKTDIGDKLHSDGANFWRREYVRCRTRGEIFPFAFCCNPFHTNIPLLIYTFSYLDIFHPIPHHIPLLSLVQDPPFAFLCAFCRLDLHKCLLALFDFSLFLCCM